MKIRISDLTERIRFVYHLTARNEYGDLIKVQEVTRCKVWARVHALAQRIEDETPERLNKTTYRITIRWREDIQPNDEIVWRGKRLKIISTPTEFEVRRLWKVFDAQIRQEDFVAETADTDIQIESLTMAVFDKVGNLINSGIKFATAAEFEEMLNGKNEENSDNFVDFKLAVYDAQGNLINSNIGIASSEEFDTMLNDLGSEASEGNREIYDWTIAAFDSDGQLVDSGLKFATAEEMTALLEGDV